MNICTNAKKKVNTIINICGHSSMCEKCAKNVIKTSATCVLCRCEIDKVLVFKKVGVGKLISYYLVINKSILRNNYTSFFTL